MDLMFQACPEIHGDGAQLDLDPHQLLVVRQKDRYAQHQMVAAVAVGLWILDIIFLLHHLQVILSGQHICYRIDVLDKRADDTNAGDVVEVGFNGFQRDGKAFSVHLFQNAHRGFDTAFNGFDGVVLAESCVPLQDFQLGQNLLNAGFIDCHTLLNAAEQFDEIVRGLKARDVIHQFFAVVNLSHFVVQFLSRSMISQMAFILLHFSLTKKYVEINGKKEKKL